MAMDLIDLAKTHQIVHDLECFFHSCLCECEVRLSQVGVSWGFAYEAVTVYVFNFRAYLTLRGNCECMRLLLFAEAMSILICT